MALAASAAQAQTCDWQVEALKLKEMAAVDQGSRQSLDAFLDSLRPGLSDATRVELKDPREIRKMQELNDAMTASDARNQQALSEMVQRCGWPKASVAGKAAASNAWLIVQHANFEFQQAHQQYIEDSYKAGELSGQNYARFVDRLLIRSGQPQRYGTQLRSGGTAGSTLGPMEDEERLDQRRKQMGLVPICEFLGRFPDLDPATKDRCK